MDFEFAAPPGERPDSGALDLKDATFRDMARAHPQIAPLHELRHSLSQLRLNELAVGSDSRSRCLLSPFRSKTGRNQPSNTRFIFGPSTWLRGLIRPSPGCGLAYVDFASQEIGIAAALSRDPALMAAYVSGDVYLSFAKQAGLAPPNATKASHGAVRDACKALVLGIGYGMGRTALPQGSDSPRSSRAICSSCTRRPIPASGLGRKRLSIGHSFTAVSRRPSAGRCTRASKSTRVRS